jgi:hypothetical protein
MQPRQHPPDDLGLAQRSRDSLGWPESCAFREKEKCFQLCR